MLEKLIPGSTLNAVKCVRVCGVLLCGLGFIKITSGGMKSICLHLKFLISATQYFSLMHSKCPSRNYFEKKPLKVC